MRRQHQVGEFNSESIGGLKHPDFPRSELRRHCVVADISRQHSSYLGFGLPQPQAESARSEMNPRALWAGCALAGIVATVLALVTIGLPGAVVLAGGCLLGIGLERLVPGMSGPRRGQRRL